MPLSKLPPVQFDFRAFWFDEFAKFRNTPPFKAELESLTSERVFRHEDLCYEDEFSHDPEQAELEFEIVKLETPVRIRDLNYLVEWFDGVSLSGLVLLIAETKYPDREWQIVENDERVIITDAERSIVFDIDYYSKISAGASLCSVADKIYIPTPADRQEWYEIHNANMQIEITALNRIKADLEQFDKAPADVLSIDQDR